MTTGLWLALLGAMVLGWKKPRWLAWITLAEILIGGKGYLFFASIGGVTLSVRMVLFLVLLVRFARPVWQQRYQLWTLPPMRWVTWLGLWVVAMVGWGLALGHQPGQVYFDSNAFAALAYLPLWLVSWRDTSDWRQVGLTVVVAGATVVGLKSLAMVYFFGHAHAFTPNLYHWIRETGVGEITNISQNVYRVFFQGQIMTLLVAVLLFSQLVVGPWRQWWWWPLSFSAIGVYLSLSRSFWLGAAGAVLVLSIMIWRKELPRLRKFLWLLPIIAGSWFITTWAINFPAWSGGQFNPALSRFSSEQSTQASTARFNQVQPLVRAISHHPLMGSGFGTTVTYWSTDPRVHGWRTTAAFELGYLDLWLKIGLIGVVLYGGWVVSLLRRANRQTFWPWLVAVVALLITHLTSPYLNHPLGLGWLAITSLIVYG